MIYFIDENLPPRLLEGIEVEGVPVSFVSLRSVYPPGTKDPQWIPDVGSKGWMVLSLDARMAHYRIHRADLETHRVTVIFLPKARFQNKKAIEQRSWVALHFNKVHSFVSSLSQPAGVRVSTTGEGTVLWTVENDTEE